MFQAAVGAAIDVDVLSRGIWAHRRSPPQRLDDLRNAWLEPADLVSVEPEVVFGYPDRILPKYEMAADKLRERTLTNLYNLRPQWLADAHQVSTPLLLPPMAGQPTSQTRTRWQSF